MKKLLVLGATAFQMPIVRKAKERGHYVITVDNVPTNPAHNIADETANISTVDLEAVLAFAREKRIDGVLTGASDVAVPTVGYLCDRLALPGIGYEQAVTLTRKDKFRAFQRNEGLPSPDFHSFECWETFLDVTRTFKGKYIIKPVDRSGSRGVSAIDFSNPPGIEQLEILFRNALSSSLARRVILEEFLEGIDLSGDVFMADGQCRMFCPTNKSRTPPPLYATTGHSVPSDLPESKIALLRDALEQTMARLSIAHGSANFDAIIDQSGRAVIIEIGGRFGGNCIPQVIECACGYDEIGASIELALGESLNSEPLSWQMLAPSGSRTLISQDDGTLKSMTPRETVLDHYEGIIYELVYDFTPGTRIAQFTQESDRIGHVIAKAPTRDALDKYLNAIVGEIEITVEPEALTISGKC